MADIMGFVFDLDGTLINSTEIGRSIEQRIFEVFNLDMNQSIKKEIDELTYEIMQQENRKNLGIKVMWEIFKLLGLNIFQRLRALYIASKIFKREVKRVKLYEGVKETFTFLDDKSIPYSIATTSSQKEVEDRLMKFPEFFSKLQGRIITRSDVKNMKPDPESMKKAAELMDVPLHRTVMVGDIHYDILMGKNADAITIAVLTGIFSEEQFKPFEPDFIIDSVANIPEIFTEIQSKLKSE
ncbi:MAG: putative Inorganic diphosphatase [Promethearchaeota archaeon]|nr:MAG: putative Inorganic diphosphatase [Candidatus Lokiarchaeota archaeon]